MEKILYNNKNILIDVRHKEIVINPPSERFYNVQWTDIDTVFEDATLFIDEDGYYTIEGRQTLYLEHSDFGMSYEKLLTLHPKELIVKKRLFGLFEYYSVEGIHKRTMQSRYRCADKKFCIIKREEVLSSEFLSCYPKQERA